MQDLRTKRTHNRYMKSRANGLLDHGCRLCQVEPIKEFKYWKIIDNEYPWDLVAKRNDIFLPKRHADYEHLNKKEKDEFDLIKSGYLNDNYEILAEATNRKKSIPGHFHVHLLILK